MELYAVCSDSDEGGGIDIRDNVVCSRHFPSVISSILYRET